MRKWSFMNQVWSINPSTKRKDVGKQHTHYDDNHAKKQPQITIIQIKKEYLSTISQWTLIGWVSFLHSFSITSMDIDKIPDITQEVWKLFPVDW